MTLQVAPLQGASYPSIVDAVQALIKSIAGCELALTIVAKSVLVIADEPVSPVIADQSVS
jgi:hypothetical protein